MNILNQCTFVVELKNLGSKLIKPVSAGRLFNGEFTFGLTLRDAKLVDKNGIIRVDDFTADGMVFIYTGAGLSKDKSRLFFHFKAFHPHLTP